MLVSFHYFWRTFFCYLQACYLIVIGIVLLIVLQILGSRSDTEAKIQQQTKEKIEDMKIRVTDKKEMALDHLVKLVCAIKPELHTNYRL